MDHGGVQANALTNWAWSLLCWDGALPLLTFATPFVLTLLPIEREASANIANGVIALAWFIRIFVTLDTADLYHGRFRVLRWGVIGLAVSFLAVVELLLINPIVFGVDVPTRSLFVAAIAYLIYFALMALATYRQPHDSLSIGGRLKDIADRTRLENDWHDDDDANRFS